MLALVVLAQTFTATAAGGSAAAISDLKAQALSFLVATAISAATALLALAKSWVSQRRTKIAEKLTSTVISGVEGTATRIETILAAHLGEDGIAALKAQGIDLDALRDQIVAATKKNVQKVAIAAGVEDKLAPLVAKVTSQRLVVDTEGNPITK